MTQIPGHNVSILASATDGQVVLDGVDISGAVRGATLRAAVGSPPSVTLDMRLHDRAVGAVDGATVRIPGLTHRALVQLGWTPPPVKCVQCGNELTPVDPHDEVCDACIAAINAKTS